MRSLPWPAGDAMLQTQIGGPRKRHLDGESTYPLPRERRRAKPANPRWVIGPAQLARLESVFAETRSPSISTREILSMELGSTIRQVSIWFRNRRQRVAPPEDDKAPAVVDTTLVGQNISSSASTASAEDVAPSAAPAGGVLGREDTALAAQTLAALSSVPGGSKGASESDADAPARLAPVPGQPKTLEPATADPTVHPIIGLTSRPHADAMAPAPALAHAAGLLLSEQHPNTHGAYAEMSSLAMQADSVPRFMQRFAQQPGAYPRPPHMLASPDPTAYAGYEPASHIRYVPVITPGPPHPHHASLHPPLPDVHKGMAPHGMFPVDYALHAMVTQHAALGMPHGGGGWHRIPGHEHAALDPAGAYAPMYAMGPHGSAAGPPPGHEASPHSPPRHMQHYDPKQAAAMRPQWIHAGPPPGAIMLPHPGVVPPHHL